jgi:protein TonB
MTTTPYYRDDSWLRLAWVVPLSLVLWAAMLTAFALLLERTAPPPPELLPAQVRIVELPPPAGLQGGPPASHPASAPPKQKVEAPRISRPPKIVRHLVPTPKIHGVRRKALPPPLPPSPAGTAKPSSEAPPVAQAPAASSATSNSGNAGAAGQGSGIGNDSSGARAIYSPEPEIPDSLRDQPLQTVAIAHFKVRYDGQVQVMLTTPTENPELNQVLLDTLKQWRFAPAIKSGIAIDSQFDVRIQISVQ